MKANIICNVYHPGQWFNWHGKEGTIEVSTLGKRPFCQVYNDAYDEGFGVRGHSREVIFAVEKEIWKHGELQGWELKSISEKGFTITVFND